MAAIVPARTSGYISALERTQVLTGICGICIPINTLINLGHGFKKANASFAAW